ncbi:MAG: hypothetical protein LBI86_08565 [Treponema sp.]|jgi:hypothetical protein|nr:hypothetical protein [Treponema sp.]
MKRRFFAVPAVLLALSALCVSGCPNPWLNRTFKSELDAAAGAAPLPDLVWPGTETAPKTSLFFTVGDPAGWDAVLAAIQASPEAFFTVTVTADLSLPPQALTGSGYADKNIVLRGDIPTRTISLGSAGSLFTIGADLALELQNITAQGRANNTAPLITVNMDGELTVKAGGLITGNMAIAGVSSSNTGVYVGAGGSFTLDGGEISGNTNRTTQNASGGGVMVDGGTFTMTSGTIRDNHAVNTAGAYGANGGGVTLRSGGVFVMDGGLIEDNTAECTGYSKGGGVSVAPGCSFTITGGIITNNTVSSTTNAWETLVWGGGVFYYTGASYANSGGTVTGNWKQIAAGAPTTNNVDTGST